VIRDTLAEKKWVRDQLTAKNTVILDARPPKQYSGEEGEEIRRGHIPGAKNLFWETTLDGEEVRVWKKKEDLEKLFAESGVTKDKEIVVHCRTGRRRAISISLLNMCSDFPMFVSIGDPGSSGRPIRRCSQNRNGPLKGTSNNYQFVTPAQEGVQ